MEGGSGWAKEPSPIPPASVIERYAACKCWPPRSALTSGRCDATSGRVGVLPMSASTAVCAECMAVGAIGLEALEGRATTT